jgi:hypothetical protein
MKLQQLLTTALTGMVCFGFFSAGAQTTGDGNTINIVTTAVPFLRVSPDARVGGMGEAGIATLPDANTGFINLAKLPFAQSKFQIGATYTPWLRKITQDVYLASLAGYYKLDDEQAINVGLRYFNLGNIQFTSAEGNPNGEGRPRELGVDFGYTRKVSERLSLGVALRYINSSLARGDVGQTGNVYKAGNSVAGDISVYHNGLNDDGQGFTYGLAITNLGAKIGYTDNALAKDYIPANLGIGAAYTGVIDEDSKITIAADINHLLVPAIPVLSDDPADSIKNQQALDDYHSMSVFQSWFKSFGNKCIALSLGAEFWYANQFSARAGYYWETKEAGNRKYWTLGVGVKYNVFGFNFSYLVPSGGTGTTQNPLSNTLRFGVTFDLDPETNGSTGGQ